MLPAASEHTVESKIFEPQFEARHRDRRPGVAELRRLQHLRDLLTAAPHDTIDAAFGLFSATGFTDELAAEASAAKARFSSPP